MTTHGFRRVTQLATFTTCELERPNKCRKFRFQNAESDREEHDSVKRLTPPFRLKIHGRMREVVDMSKFRWTERLHDGSLVHHIGKLVSDQEPKKIMESWRPCSVCGNPTITSTWLDRAVHATCESHTVTIPDEVAMNIIFGVARDLGADILEVRDTA